MEEIYEYIISLVFGNANAFFSDILPVILQPGVSRLQSVGSLLFFVNGV